MFKKILFIMVIATVLIGTSGCITIKKQTSSTSTLGGMFFTDDRFETWKHKSLLMTPGETPGSISDTDIYFMRFDPSDVNAIYIGTRTDGLYYSYNGGAGWTKSEKLPAGFVRDMIIDTKDKCTLYAAVEDKIYKSGDCARTWDRVFYSDNTTKKVTSLEIDWYDPSIVYAGMSDGTLLKSVDYGLSWTNVYKFKARINKLVVDPNNSFKIYAGIVGEGLYRTDDKGANWLDLNPSMKDFKAADTYYDFVVSTSSKDVVLYLNKYGLLRSLDSGETWMDVKLLTQPRTEILFSVAIDPKNASNIYYSTDKAIYKTLDGGNSWVVKKMPTTRIAGEIMVHPEEGDKLFVGAKTVEL